MIVVIDTETTGIDPAGHAVVEVAAVPLTWVDIPPQFAHDHTPGWQAGHGISSLVAPGRRVPPAARAVHHLGDAELRAAPKLRGAMSKVIWHDKRGLNDVDAIAAHNAEFDRGFVGKFFPAEVPWLCTWRCALHLYSDADSHSNQALRYYLPGVDDDFGEWCQFDREFAVLQGSANMVRPEMQPHRALYDAGVTAHVLRHMLGNHTIEELLALQAQPVLQRTVRFGKHRGTPWADVPKDYCKWIFRADPPFDSDVIHTANHYLNGGQGP